MRAARKIAVALVSAMMICLACAGSISAQTCQPAAVECLQPRRTVEDDGARFAWGSTRSKDAWVARFDGGSKKPTWRTNLGGSGDDAVAALARGPEGVLLVAGSTTSPELDGFTGRNSGGKDGFVARLDAVTGRLLSGAFVGGPGEEELSGVVTNSAGDVLVAGIGSVGSFGEKPETLTVIESDTSGPGSPAFLAILEGGLARERARHDLGSIRVRRPRVWTDCKGNLVFGVVAMGGSGSCNGNWPDLVYEQDQIDQDYTIDHSGNDPDLGYPQGGWGYHALRWKYYHANANLPGEVPYSLDWGTTNGIAIPKSAPSLGDYLPAPPGCSTAATLNQLETSVFSQNNTTVDPPGYWSCGIHSTRAQLALYAAHFFRRWKTPVYTLFKEFDFNNEQGGWDEYSAVLERVTFRPHCASDPGAYQGQTLDELCDLMVDNPEDLTCTTDTSVPGVNGSGFHLKLIRLEGRVWGWLSGSLVYWFKPRTWSSDHPIGPPHGWYLPGEYVMDPPAGAEAELAVLQEAARQTSDRIVRDGRVLVTRQVKGVSVCKETVEAVIPASE